MEVREMLSQSKMHGALCSLLPAGMSDSHPGHMLQLNVVQFVKNKAATTKNS